MRAAPRTATALVCLSLFGPARAEGPVPLPGTKPLTLEGDIPSALVDGVDRFLSRKLEGTAPRDWGSPDREALKRILGVRDARIPFDAPEVVATVDRPAIVGKGRGYEVFTIRWPAFGGVHGEGLLLFPVGREKVADVVAIPDADQTPEMIAGLAPGVAPGSQYARRLAESGCRVIIPVLVDRKIEPRNGRAKLTSREYLHRSAFELGRLVIGYEVEKVLAAVDWFEKDAHGADPKIGVFGWGEGGLIALYTGAVDPRIDAVGVSGYVDDRRDVWREPLDRNIFGVLQGYADNRVLAMIAPRSVVVEAAKGPEVVIPPGLGGAPGRLKTPSLADVRPLVDGARKMAERSAPSYRIELAVSGGDGLGPFGSAEALTGFLDEVAPGSALADDHGAPEVLAAIDPAPRQARQVHEIDRHNQRLLAEGPYLRQAYFAKLDTSSPASYAKTIEPYRETFRAEVLGAFEDPLLPADPRTRRVYDEPGFTGYEVVLDVYPDVIAYGILLVPKGIKDGEKRPVVVCQHGLEGRPQDVADPKVDSPFYHKFAVKLAEQGFVTFAPQNLYIFGDRFRTLQRKANPIKKTLWSVIVPQHQQITDWLKTLPIVDPARIGFYGLSYGGKTAMRVPPLVSNYALSICSGDFNQWVDKNASTRSPYSYVWTGEYEIYEWDLNSTFDYAEMAALIAPRPFMVERGHFDAVGSDEAVGGEFAKVRFLYQGKLGIGDRCEIEWFTGPHTIHGAGTFEFLRKHLIP